MFKDHHWYPAGVIALVTAIIVIAAGAFLMYFGQIKAALTPKPETFTELYFENHLNLPKTIVQGNSYTVSFTIHNLEYKTVTYPVDVYVEDEADIKASDILFSTVKTLNQDQSVTIPVTFSIPISQARRDKIVIKLTTLDQSIDFWVESKPPLPGSVTPSSSPSAVLQAL